MNKKTGVIVIFMTLLLTLNVFAAEQSGDMFHIGVRPGVTLADGQPANDILSVGVFGRYRLTDRWLVGIALDQAEFDFEEPAKLLGLKAMEVVDASTTESLISAWIEREFNTQSDWLTPFLGAGLGIGIVETDDVTGPLAGDGTFDITTDPGMEIIPSILAGLRFSWERESSPK